MTPSDDDKTLYDFIGTTRAVLEFMKQSAQDQTGLLEKQAYRISEINNTLSEIKLQLDHNTSRIKRTETIVDRVVWGLVAAVGAAVLAAVGLT